MSDVFSVMAALVFVLVFLAVWARYLRPAIERARKYIAQVSQCGFLAPPPSRDAWHFTYWLARFMQWWQVGPVTVHHPERLDLIRRRQAAGHQIFEAAPPVLVIANHSSSADPAVMALILDGPARYMAAKGCFTFAGGLGSLLFGPIGAFCADLNKGKGGPAADAMVAVLTSGQVGVMFPEGWAWMDGVFEQCKKGAARIMKRAARALRGQTVYALPIYIRYHAYPGSWIRRLPPPLQYLLVFLCPFLFRRGATVMIGMPVPHTVLSADDREGTELLRQRIGECDPATYPWWQKDKHTER